MAKPRRVPATAGAPQRAASSPKGAEKPKMGNMDLTFFFIVLVLLVLGIVMLFSASYAIAINEGTDGLKYIKRQMIFAGMGLTAMLVLSRIDYHILRKTWIAYGLFSGALSLLILVLLLPTDRNDGFKRWIDIGNPEAGFSFSFQPSEIMKLAIIVLFAYIISVNYSRMKEFKYGILPFGIVLGVVSFLMYKEPHLSGMIIICAIGAIMMFVGGANIKHFLALGITAVIGGAAYIAYKVSTGDLGHVTARITSWLDPFADSQGDTWQTQQSLIAIGSGGLFGLGFGNSRQKFMYLPAAENDFIFAIICEELGFIGAIMIILLFALFVFRGFYIATKAPDKFGMMLAVGLTIQIGLQALLNIAVVTNAIPNTGISLPFFSYGGTALTMQLAQMGFILNISRQATIET